MSEKQKPAGFEVVVYTKTDCPNCVTAKQILEGSGLPYTVKSLDDHAARVEFTTMCPDIRQMPQVFINGQRVGGLAGLQAALKQISVGSAS